MHRLWLVLLGACAAERAPAPAEPTGVATRLAPAPVDDARFASAIMAAAHHYTEWGRVDAVPRAGNVACAAPPSPSDNGRVRMSAADDAPHGKKLYYLWASDRVGYLDGHTEVPVGFAIVKESFAATPSDKRPGMSFDQPLAWVDAGDGTFLVAGERRDLFVMTKLAEGWIYGTVAPDGTVSSAGHVATCAGCHDPQHDKLFGLKR